MKCEFKDDFKQFRQYCLDLGYNNVMNSTSVNFRGRDYYLTHDPNEIPDNIKTLSLYGHIHRLSLISGFGINVGCDQNNYKPFSESDITQTISLLNSYMISEPGYIKAVTTPFNSELWNKKSVHNKK